MRRRVVWAAVVFAVLAAVLAVGLYRTEPAVQTQTLADGSVMILRGVTFGRVHHLAMGNLLQRSAGRWIPAMVGRHLGLQVLAYSNTQPCLVVWAEQKKPGTTRRPKGGYTATPVIVSDDAGTEFEHVGAAFGSQGTNYLVEAFPFSAFPHASRMVNICIRAFDYEKKQYLDARFRVPNPAFARAPVGTPTAYPVRVQQDELAFELSDFHPCAPPAGSRARREAWMSTSYRILDKANPTNDWRVRGISVCDDAGAGYSPSAFRGLPGASRTNAQFRGGLGTNTEWLLRFSLERESYSSNELVTIRHVPIPGRSEEPFAPVSVEAQEVTLTVTGFNGANYVLASFSPPAEDLRLQLLRLVDDQGREGRITVTGMADNAKYHFGVVLEKDAKWADLTFALRRDRKVEVCARPTGKVGD